MPVSSVPSHKPLLIVSNRAPVEFHLEQGRPRWRSCEGGLATALSSLQHDAPITWIASAQTETDRALAGAAFPLWSGTRLRFVAPPEQAQELAYGVFSNPVLWFLQHGLGQDLNDLGGRALGSWGTGYQRINRDFASAVIDELRAHGGSGWVMLHDYHLYTAATWIREACPEAVLQHFIHIPWPEPAAWLALPRHMVRSMCEGLLANDSVVFQTEESARNFLLTCEEYANATHISYRRGSVSLLGHETKIWANPISVDVDAVRALASSPEAVRYRDSLAAQPEVRTIVRVDRLDPSKNVLAGFEAFRLLLRNRPGWHERVRMLAFLVPSRENIPEYSIYRNEVLGLADRINAEFSGWKPVEVFHERNRLQALAGLTLYDVLLVNSIADGMNLVAKEGPAVNERSGALVLSTRAGAHEELHPGAISVEPENVFATSQALHDALSLSPAERRERAARLFRVIERRDLDRWLAAQLDDLADRESVAAPVAIPAGPAPIHQWRQAGALRTV